MTDLLQASVRISKSRLTGFGVYREPRLPSCHALACATPPRLGRREGRGGNYGRFTPGTDPPILRELLHEGFGSCDLLGR